MLQFCSISKKREAEASLFFARTLRPQWGPKVRVVIYDRELL